MPEVRWERMFPDQLETAFAQCPLLYLPYGLCEPHGPHDTLGLDALKAHAICIQAAQAHGGIVAPPDYWHIHEISGFAAWSAARVGEVQRTWLTAMPPWQHFRNVLYHLRQADAIGFKAAILLTGHYGPNWQDLKTLIEWVQPHVGTRLYALPDWEANTPGFDNDGRSGGDHAGKVETSLLMALEPDCVDLSRLPAVDQPDTHFAMGKNAYEANLQVGQRMVQDEVRYLWDKAQELLADYDRLQPQHTLTTFEQVERLWAQTVHPRLYELITMQQHWSEHPAPDESSIWRRNWTVPQDM